MSTDVEIASMALSHIGQSEISSLAGTDKVSKEANRHYQQAVDWVLMQREWRDAVTRASLTSAGTPEYGWTDYYTLPADCLRLLEVRSSALESSSENPLEWEQEGGLVLCDVSTGVKIRYLARLDEADISPHIVDVIALELARRICVPLTNSKTLKKQLDETMFGTNPKTDKGLLAEAAAVDGMQRGRTRVLRSSAITKARVSSGRFIPDVG